MNMRWLVVGLTLTGCPVQTTGEGGSEGEGEPSAEGEGEPGEGEGELTGEGEGELTGEGEGEPLAPTCTLMAPRRIIVTEGGMATFVIGCAEAGAALLSSDVVMPVLPAGAVFDAITMQFNWATDVDDAATHELVFGSAAAHVVGPITVDVDVADALFDASNQPIVNALGYHRELGLPVVFVSTRPTDEAYENTTVIVGGQQSSGQIKLRGAFSINYSKQSFTVKTDEPIDLPGIGMRDKFVLTSTFDDKAAVRQRIVYELWNELGARPDPLSPREHIRVDVNQAVVYIDGSYEGLYTLGDHVNRDRFGDSLDIDDQGNLYKAINHDANFMVNNSGGDRKDDLMSGYVSRDEPTTPVDPQDDLRSLINFVITSDDAAFDADIGNRIDLDDAMDWWLLVSITDAADSIGKNSYLYSPKGPTEGRTISPGEQRFRAVPWDFNHALGQAWEASHTDPSGDLYGYNGGSNALFGRLLSSAVHGPVMRARAGSRIHGGVLDVASVLARFDDRAAAALASAHRDELVWDASIRAFYASYFGREQFSTTDEELAYTRNWIIDRWSYFGGLYP